MNVEKLIGITDILLEKEGALNIQGHLSSVLNLVNKSLHNPQDVNRRNAVVESILNVKNAYDQIRSSFDPFQQQMLSEIGADAYFINDFPAHFLSLAKSSNIHPLYEFIVRFHSERNAYITALSQLRNGLAILKFEAPSLKPGEANIGFLLPRQIFNNDFEELIDELRELKFIIRTFSEIATGGVEHVEVKQISTTDPIFFLKMAAQTVLLLGTTISWSLTIWKKYEEAIKLRNENKKFWNDAQMEELQIKMTKQMLENSKKEKVDEILALSEDKTPRKHELRNQIETALDSILSRVERGMVVEIKFRPSEIISQDEQEAQIQNEQEEKFKDLMQNMADLPRPIVGQQEYLLPLKKTFSDSSGMNQNS